LEPLLALLFCGTLQYLLAPLWNYSISLLSLTSHLHIMLKIGHLYLSMGPIREWKGIILLIGYII
jgi:hypothetical protein